MPSLWSYGFVLLAAAAGMAFQPAAPESFTSSRELLQSIGVEESHFDLLVDSRPLDESEQEPLLRFLYAIRKFPLEEARRFTRAKFTTPQSAEASNGLRGEIYQLKATVTHVTIELPRPEAVDRYGIERYYRCRVELESGQLATVLALDVPKAWPIEKDVSQRTSCNALYLKRAPAGSNDLSQPVFAAARLAWHPEGVLGDAGMDCGLFDQVANQESIRAEERECFYQLLWAAGRIDPLELFRLTDRAPSEDYSVVPLFNDAAHQHGELVALTGTARRAMLVRLDERKDADLIERFGFDHYYQVEIFTDDSQGNPLVFCVRELPDGFPQGPQIYESVRIPAFFFKTWAYRLQSLDGQPSTGYQLAPMLVGHQLQWIPQPAAYSGTVGVVVILSLLLLAGIAIWAFRSSDRRFHDRVMARRRMPDNPKSLNDLNLEARDGL